MAFRKENIHLIPNWFRSSCSQIGVFLKLCKIHAKTYLLDSLLNNIADIKAWNFIKKRLRYRYFPVNFQYFFKKTLFTEHLQITAPCWFLRSNHSFTNWSHFVRFFLYFFSFIIDNCSCRSLLRKCLKMNIFCFLQKCFTFCINVVKTISPRQ